MSTWLPRLLLRAASALCLLASPAIGAAPVLRLHIATVDNDQMKQLQDLGAEFEASHPGIRLKWVVFQENALRRYVESDIATGAHQFDVVTIGLYEAALWPARGWLQPFKPGPDYDLADLLPTIRDGLSYQGSLHAAPLYGESSMLMYRKDLMRKAGLTMPPAPSWQDIARIAAVLNDPAHGVHGICLRANPGWGANMALVTTMVNAFGGQWFDAAWHPRLKTRAWRDAVGLYVSLLRNYGPPDPVGKGFNENLALFEDGKCALWVDATVAAAYVSSGARSRHAAEIGFAAAPVAVTEKGSRWLWCWALAIPAGVAPERAAAAQQFLAWASSRDYVALVARRKGWRLVPSGTRRSTYASTGYRRAAPWAAYELAAIQKADMGAATLPKSPYRGVQFAAIPAFRTIGDEVGRNIGEAVAGRLSVEEALERSQHIAARMVFLD